LLTVHSADRLFSLPLLPLCVLCREPLDGLSVG
jgi:hypothetical protein